MLKGVIHIKKEPDSFRLEKTTIWSFPDRGSWATHSGKYRGNWSPYIPRNLMLRYTKKGNWVLDQFLGSGTTLIEAKLLERNAIGIDINLDSINLSNSNLNFSCSSKSIISIRQGNAQNLDFIKDQSIDMICTHPPYANIIKYSSGIKDDISCLSYKDFMISMGKVSSEAYRVLKPNSICAFMIGDIRKNGYVIPLGMDTMHLFIKAGFKLKEIIIKEQHNCKSTKYWELRNPDFLLLAHEYIFVLERK